MGKGKHKGKKRKSEGEKTIQKARTVSNKSRTQKQVAKKLEKAKVRRERKLTLQ